MKKTIKILLIIIVLLAAFLRLYKLDQIPASLNWDEVDAGYNAYTIANWGRDEWNKTLPLVFSSFKDDKHPVHIYLTAPFVKILGLSDFSTRFPSALIGILSVVVMFYLVRILFKNDLTALTSALFLTVSPYHIHFSRGLWEVNFALFFFMFGLLMFYLGISKKNWLINIAYLSFGICLLSYHSSKIIVPPIVLVLTIFYFKDLRRLSKNFYSSIFIFLIFIMLLLLDQRLLGLTRAKQTQFEQKDIEKTQIYQKTHNSSLGLGEIILGQYLSHFTPKYLFISGDESPRNSVKVFGEFYKTDAIFLIIGIIYLLKMKSKITLLLLVWLLLAPIPASLVKGAPSATRSIFLLGILILVSGLGAGVVLSWFKRRFKSIVLLILFIVLGIQVYPYCNYYFNSYLKKDAHEWQYGMKQIVDFVKSNPKYQTVYMTDTRSQPYIYFLYYLKYPLPDFTNTVIYNTSDTKNFSLVSSFGNYYFGGWDPIESVPTPGVLYVLTPSQYDGLKYRSGFDVKKIIYYPDGGNAFFIVGVI